MKKKTKKERFEPFIFVFLMSVIMIISIQYIVNGIVLDINLYFYLGAMGLFIAESMRIIR